MKSFLSTALAAAACLLHFEPIGARLPPTGIPLGEIAMGDFPPLACNSQLNTTTCTSFTAEAYDLEDIVMIPCGKCLIFDVPDGGNTTFTAGLEITGKLVIPKNMKQKIFAPFIHIQGALEITNDEVITNETSLEIIMTGTADEPFFPHAQNSASCSNSFCDTGKKTIVVAGGQLDINAMPEDCPAWVKLHDIVVSQNTVTVPEIYPRVPIPPVGCDALAFLEDFESGQGLWKSSLGSTDSLDSGSHDGSNYFSVGNRTRSWQGPFISFSHWLRDCMLTETHYLVKAKYRLVPEVAGTNSNCHNNGTDCLALTLHRMANDTRLSWRPLFTTPAVARSQDGVWTDFQAVIEFKANDVTNDGIYQMLYFSGPEPGIRIEIDDVQMTLPFPNMFPDPNGIICSTLITNGDASVSDEYAYPFLLVGNAGSYLQIKKESVNGTDNNYFAITGRNATWCSITQDMINDCIVKNSIYKFKMKVRVHSVELVKVRFSIKTFSPEARDPDFIIESIGYCPLTNAATGWVQCERTFLFKYVHENATKIELSFIVEDNLTADIDYDDISVTLHAPPVSKFVLPGEVASCWGIGAKILQTSHTLNYKDANVLSILNVTTRDDGMAVVTIDDGIAKPTTQMDDPRVAVEVALLSRMVKITGADDDPVNPFHGANLMVLHTPNVPQKIDGVLFLEMGQQGLLGRYPIHFHMCENVDGTVVSRNSIVDSNQRCLVIHNTHNVTVDYNIGYHNFGHCFFLEDGIEQDNKFNYNLGAGQMVTPPEGILSIAESDMFPATFWISNPKNYYNGNVAAGGEDNGFWFEMLEIIRGPSQKKDPTYSINPSEFQYGFFKNQVTHSNGGDGFKLYPNGYFPKERAWFENLYSYRNVGDGNLMHNSANLGVLGGYYADNRRQIEIDKQADDVVVKDALVEGFTPLYQIEVQAGKRKSHCPAWRPLVGIQLHSFLRYRDSKGYHIQNVTFRHFGASTGCVGSTAFEMDDEVRDGHFDAYTVFEDIHFDPPDAPFKEKFTTCDLAKNPMFHHDLVIEDKTGDLNPAGNGVRGYIISNSTKMSSFATCVDMEGSCALYCEGTDICYRSINIAVPPSWDHDDVILEVTRDDDGKVVNFYGYIENKTTTVRNQVVEDTYENYVYQRRKYFTAIFPQSAKYTLRLKKNGQLFWPQFAEIVWEDPPNCTTYATDADLTFEFAPPTQSDCDAVVRNPGAEDGYHSNWVHVGGGVKVVQGTAGDDVNTGSYAISSVKRSLAYHGPGQFLDTRCWNVGDQWEIMMKVRLRDGDAGAYKKCNINRDQFLASDVCPRVSFRIRTFQGNTIADEVDMLYAYPMAVALGPWREDKWNKLYGVIKVTEEMANADTVLMFVERARPGLQIIVDDVSVKKTFLSCDMPIHNADLEAGDTRWWYSIGTTEIDMYSPGYSGAYALRTISRYEFWGSMAQKLDRECMTLGIDYEVSAMFKLLNAADDLPTDCNPYISWGGGSNVCPTMSLRIVTGQIVKDIDIGSTSPTYTSGGQWNGIYGSFNATEEIMMADIVSLYFRKFHHSLHLVIDDVTVIGSVAQDVKQVINNNDLSAGDARYFSLHNGGFIDVVQPGYDGASDYALKVTGRTSDSFGVSQIVDNSVLKAKALYKVRAQVKLFTDDSLTTPFTCDPRSNDPTKRCPLMSLRAHTMGEAPITRIVTAAPRSWLTGDWNAYESTVQLMPYELQAQSLRLIIDGAAVNTAMVIDDVEFRVVSANTDAPTVFPSLSPSETQSPSSAPIPVPTAPPTDAPTDAPTITP